MFCRILLYKYQNAIICASSKEKSVISLIKEICNSMQYSVAHAVFDAKDTGLPHSRNRVYIDLRWMQGMQLEDLQAFQQELRPQILSSLRTILSNHTMYSIGHFLLDNNIEHYDTLVREWLGGDSSDSGRDGSRGDGGRRVRARTATHPCLCHPLRILEPHPSCTPA